MEIISRKEALSQGLTQYFTGHPCKQGHILPRRVNDRQCTECGKLRKRSFRAQHTERLNEYDRKRHKTGREQTPEKYRKRSQTYRAELRSKVIALLGGAICANCGCQEESILEINHILGRRHYNKEFHITTWNKILKGAVDKSEFNVLCKLCNTLHYIQDLLHIKGHEVKWRP